MTLHTVRSFRWLTMAAVTAFVFSLSVWGSSATAQEAETKDAPATSAAATHPTVSELATEGESAAEDAALHHGHADPPGTPPLLQFDAGSAIVNIAIFLGVFAILSKLVWPVILDGLKARESKIRSDLEAAEAANAQANSLLASYQSKLSEAQLQIQTMLAEAQKTSEAVGKRIVDEAKAEADRQRTRAISDIETAKKVAISELAGKTSEMAMQVASKVVGRELNPADHAELIRKSLDHLPSNN